MITSTEQSSLLTLDGALTSRLVLRAGDVANGLVAASATVGFMKFSNSNSCSSPESAPAQGVSGAYKSTHDYLQPLPSAIKMPVHP